MAGKRAFATQFLFFLALLLQYVTIGITQHHHVHHVHRQLHRSPSPSVAAAGGTQESSTTMALTLSTSPIPSAVLSTANSNVEGAKLIIKQALNRLAIMNKLQLENTQFNKYEFKDHMSANSRLFSEGNLAPPLDMDTPLKEFEKMDTKAARSVSANGTRTYAYSIPEDLKKAAHIVAESAPPVALDGEYARLAAEMREKHAAKANDTNISPQALLGPDGLSKYVSGWEARGINVGANSSEAVTQHDKRATESYWMTDIEQRGKSPFTPDSYKVNFQCDGITDDTDAINLAISDGGRCGANCGSSTIFPAVIYFPAGTYLISSSIIQYYNTQFLRDPHDHPTILAAASFVGLGVITSDVYISDNEQWYINQSNFLRSIRNFVMDIRRTNPNAYVCAIHWQVAQGTSLENIQFFMAQGTTQQGIYMENGSGGFLSDLTFMGGNFGAYFGNQQFTTRRLIFLLCKTAIQIHWDWAWTMQDVYITSCETGIVIVGGAGGPMSDGQPVGSLIIMDSLISYTPTGILTSLYTENLTALLVQNTVFTEVDDAIIDSVLSRTLVAGGEEVYLRNWGFGMLSSKSGVSQFVTGQEIPAMNRTESLLGEDSFVEGAFFSRGRPAYYDVGLSQIMDVKAYGAKGDGGSDDTLVLNSVLQSAANLSAIVYFPFGVYTIKDTLHIPVGSRIIGQAWSQIMATGPKFGDSMHTRPVVQVGNKGDRGIVEIQDMMITVSGPTRGAILMEWNVHESTQGSAGLWDTHFRVGGAIGSNLQAEECPKSSFLDVDCIAASLLLHLTPESSAYMENIWVWVADHDLDKVTQDQINVYAGCGVLIESQGPTWLYGTASEHAVLYQYQLSDAKNIFMGMIQTESPYFQPRPGAPLPIPTGIFPNDPTFDNCPDSVDGCSISWAVRIIDSETVYILGAGLYSWFSAYSQECLETEDCQERGFEIEQTTDIWIYNLCTKAIVEMVSPVGEPATLAADNKNGFLSSILAWVQTSNETVGERDFEGFRVHKLSALDLQGMTDECKTALTQTIKCHDNLARWQEPAYRGPIDDLELAEAVCDSGCGRSLKNWFDSVSTACAGQQLMRAHGRAIPMKVGGTIWAGYNETCLLPEICTGVFNSFTKVNSYKEMPHDELCSDCYVEHHRIMQSSPYSVYHQSDLYKDRLQYIYATCVGLSGTTDILPAPYTPNPVEPDSCFTETTYITKAGDTCDTIAQTHFVASAALQQYNPQHLYNCTNVKPGHKVCLPLTCEKLYVLQANDTCFSIERSQEDLMFGDLRAYNPWIDFSCDNLQTTTWVHGHTLCLSPQAGIFNTTDPVPGVIIRPALKPGYTMVITSPPEGAVVAEGTTLNCGKWHTVADEEESCVKICTSTGITIGLFEEVNPSIVGGESETCTDLLQVGSTYCVGPVWGWDTM